MTDIGEPQTQILKDVRDIKYVHLPVVSRNLSAVDLSAVSYSNDIWHLLFSNNRITINSIVIRRTVQLTYIRRHR